MTPRPRLRRWSRHHLGVDWRGLLLLTGIAALLYASAGVGMAYVAGFAPVRHTLVHPDWPWLAVSLGSVAISFAGYYFGYRGVGTVEGGPDDLDVRSRLAAVTAGFGGFLAHGGGAIDEFVLREGGASEREAKVRVILLGFLEHGVLSIPCSAAAVALLIAGRSEPPRDFTLPWAIAPAVGFAAAFWAAERHRERLRDRDGWRGRLGLALDSVHLVYALFRRFPRYWSALGGMLLFWLAEILSLWAALAAFRFHMNVGSEVVAFGTAMIVTRRTGPLAGAGILMVAIPPTLWVSGAPWAPAVLGTFAYRFFTLWVPLPFSLAALPRLRAVAKEHAEVSEQEAAGQEEPALPR